MLSRIWQFIKFDQFAQAVEKFATLTACDLFLTAPGFPSKGVSYICFEPSDECVLTETISESDIADFSFANDHLTFGYLSYQAGQIINGQAITKPTDFPLAHLKKYFGILKYDSDKQELTLNSTKQAIFNRVVEIIDSEAIEIGPIGEVRSGKLESSQSFQQIEYQQAVARTIDYIRNGYIYQLNLSIKYSVNQIELDAKRFFVKLWQTYPAPYYCYFESGDYQITSTSPECFLNVTNGAVLSQPIKGTLRFDQYDPSLVRQLTESDKESSELSMIVDMIRNDIGKNCEYGSVEVSNHKSTFIVDNLIQMYSNVTGKLKAGKNCVDLLLESFPGGSITGCPKKKAMELIDKLEPHSRDVYCGSFFVIKDEQNLDSSIAIRTGYYDSTKRQFNHFAGSGIVVDSVPENEYMETMAKADKFFKVLSEIKGRA